MPAKGLERTIRLITKGAFNIVNAVQVSALTDEATAWEVLFEGVLDAFAERLAQEPDGSFKAFEIGDALANKVRMRQVAESRGGTA